MLIHLQHKNPDDCYNLSWSGQGRGQKSHFPAHILLQLKLSWLCSLFIDQHHFTDGQRFIEMFSSRGQM